MQTKQEIEKQYIYRLYKYDDEYVLHLKTSDMNYYGNVKVSDIRDVTSELFVIAKSTKVNNEEVINIYSNKEIISYQKKQINLFDAVLPNNGELSDMLVDDAVIGNEGENNNEEVIDDQNDDNQSE